MTVTLTLIVPAADADLARSICDTISPENYSGMFPTPCGPTSSAITHYITSGPCSERFAALAPRATWERDEDGAWVQTDYYPGEPITVADLCRAAEPPLEITDDQVTDLWAAADVSTQDPFVALARLGLMLAVKAAASSRKAEDEA